MARFLTIWLVCALACLPVIGARAQDAPNPERMFVVDLQKALRADDRDWIANHCRYPVRVGLPGLIQVPNRATLLRNYGRIFTAPLKASVLAQDPDQVFRNYQGTMVGDGATNIWIRGNDAERDKQQFGIVTVNTTR